MFSRSITLRTKVVPPAWLATEFETTARRTTTMSGPAKNRLHDYEAGWLTLLLQMGVAEESCLREAQNRLAQAAIDQMNERCEWRRAKRARRSRKVEGE